MLLVIRPAASPRPQVLYQTHLRRSGNNKRHCMPARGEDEGGGGTECGGGDFSRLFGLEGATLSVFIKKGRWHSLPGFLFKLSDKTSSNVGVPTKYAISQPIDPSVQRRFQQEPFPGSLSGVHFTKRPSWRRPRCPLTLLKLTASVVLPVWILSPLGSVVCREAQRFEV